MADEPQHPMEPRLRAWAQSRRQQAGPAFDLHPADRARLHQEIGRVQDAAVGSSVPAIPFWRALLPRLSFIGALTALLLLAIFQWMPRQEGQDTSLEFAQLSKEEASSAPTEPVGSEAPERSGQRDPEAPLRVEMRPDSPLSAPARPGAQVDQTSRSQALPSPTAAPPEPEPKIAAPPVETAPMAPRMMPSEEPTRRLLTDRYGLAAAAQTEAAFPETQPTAPSPTPAPRELPAPEALTADNQLAMRPTTPAVTRETSAVSLLRSNLSADTRRGSVGDTGLPQPRVAESPPDWSASFVRQQAARRNLNAPPDVALQSFKVEQRGQNFQVLDADGSVYRGSVRVGQSAADLPVAQRSFTGGVIPSNGLSFQVTGTNQTSQRVLFFQGLVLTGATDRLQGDALLGGRDRIVVEARERK